MPKRPPPIPKLVPPKAPSKAVAPAKTFKVEPWTGENEGEKIVGYGDTGMGKTTLFSMLPSPIFIGLDDGGRRIVNPKTDDAIQHIPDIKTYQDVRDVLHQVDLFPAGSSCVIDTVTLLEQLAERHVLETIPMSKGGRATNLKAYGWNDGSSHVLDAIRLILQDLDALVRRGVNIGLICQEQAITIANPEGVDYLQACPKLHHDRQYSIMLEICAWADHILRIGYLSTVVRTEGKRITGKVVKADATRAVYIGGAQDYRAKSRTLHKFKVEDGSVLECVSFATPDDSSIWDFMFNEDE
jgi:hypothetical protein